MSDDNNNNKNNTCSICFDECKDKRIMDPCNHEFCQQCISKWSVKSLTTLAAKDPVVAAPQVTCPNCRSPISAYILSRTPVVVEEPVDLAPFERERARMVERELDAEDISFDSFLQLLPSSVVSIINSSVATHLAAMPVPESYVPEARDFMRSVMMSRFFAAAAAYMESRSPAASPPRHHRPEVIDLTGSAPDAATTAGIRRPRPSESFLRRSNRFQPRAEE